MKKYKWFITARAVKGNEERQVSFTKSNEKAILTIRDLRSIECGYEERYGYTSVIITDYKLVGWH